MKLSQLLTSASVLALMVSASAANAASQCKGLSETACAADSSCRWVAGYVRKDGREVAAYCRLGQADTKTLGTGATGNKLSASK